MSGSIRSRAVILALFPLAALGGAGLTAQSIPAACAPLIAAERKQISTPHHAYSSEASGKTSRTSETISTGGLSYLNYKGKWMRSPLTPAARRAQLDSNLSTATALTCSVVGSESVGGTPATIYQSHSENAGVKADTRSWVANGSGLLLRQEEDLDTGGGDKRHLSLRYEYGSVQAPAGVQ